MRTLLRRLIDRLRRDHLDAELRDELAFHRRMLERDGAPSDAAGRQLGNTTRYREEARDVWSLGWLDTIARDFRYAVRGLRRSPGFTTIVTLTLGLGIGANVAIFDVTDRLMFRPFPHLHDPSTVHRVYLRTTANGKTRTSATYPYARYLDLRNGMTTLATAVGLSEWRLAVGVGDAAAERQVVGADAGFFELFDAAPALGRYFTAAEDAIPRGADVVVLGYDYWISAFGGRNVLGEKVQVGPLVLTVIGIAPKGFVGLSEGEAPAVFLPITTLAYGVNQGNAQTFSRRYNWDWMTMIVRRRPGVTIEQASADLSRAFVASREGQRASTPSVLPATLAHPEAIAGPVRLAAGPSAGLESRTLLWVDGVAVIVLLIACANVLNLILARALARRREIAVRLSLGVSRRRLGSQFAAEGIVLAALGCVAGVAFAASVSAALSAMIVRNGTNDVLVGDWRALTIASIAAFALAVAMSVAPMLFAPRDDVAGTLRSGARVGGDRTSSRVRGALLVFQAALSVMLLAGAGLFVRSLQNVRALRLGWNPEPVLVVVPNYRGVQFDTGAMNVVHRALLDAARSVGGVASVTRVNSMPFATNYRKLFVVGIDSVDRLGRFNYQATTPEYFDVIGTRIVRGRGLTPSDRGAAARVAVVSQSMARSLWPGVDPIGQCFRMEADTMPCTSVIGVAEDAVQNSITDSERLLYYIPDDGPPPQRPGNRLWVRFSDGDPSTRIEALRRATQRVMPAPGYVTVSRLEDLVDAQRRSWTLGATMFVAFGALALLVAAVGLYGVIAYGATQRMHELSVRVALGAQRADIMRLVVAQAISFGVAGVVAGTVTALVASRWVQPLLFNESARDPLVFACVAGVIGVVTIVASATPANRAASADPNAALRVV